MQKFTTNKNENIILDDSSKKIVWEKVCIDIRNKLGNNIYESWIKKLKLSEELEHYIVLSAPTRFIRDWVVSRYLDQIIDIVKNYKPNTSRIDFIIENVSINKTKTLVLDQIDDKKNNLNSNVTFISESHLSYNRIDLNKNFENFVVGPSNNLAYEASKKVCERISYYNPLFLYGGIGMGKTHLLNAIGLKLKENLKVMFISAERFMYQFIKSIKSNEMVKFKEFFRNTDVFIIDDIQFVSGKEAIQEEFFHTFNALIDQNKQLIISADKSPQDLEGIEERMRSRLGWGLVADIHPLNYELRLGILQAKSEKLTAKISENILEFLAHKITTNVRELEGALNRLSAFSSLIGSEINLDMVQDLLKDLLKSSQKKVNIEEIQKKVSQHFNIKMSDMSSARRSRTVARPRQVAMYLSKNLTSRSLPEIGRRFGNRDHTTVIHAVRKVEELRNKDASFDEDVQLLIRMLES